jgi:L-aspartate oxidase
VYLDISMIANFSHRFPTISQLCRSYGIDIESGKLPVVPGAHFLMGGIKTDVNGRTSVAGLYAVGEAACTGVHGANRLASNSLLEGIVFGKRLAEILRNGVQENHFVETCKYTENHFMKKLTKTLPSKQQIQTRMMQYVGIVRNESGLECAKQWFEQFSIPDLLSVDLNELTIEEITIINMIIIGWMITTSALKRTESRGGHYRTDYPSMDKNWKGTRIVRTKEELFVNV